MLLLSAYGKALGKLLRSYDHLTQIYDLLPAFALFLACALFLPFALLLPCALFLVSMILSANPQYSNSYSLTPAA